MSPRTGRPPINNPKNIDIKVRIDKETNEKLTKYCEKQGITRADAIRGGIKEVLKKEEQ